MKFQRIIFSLFVAITMVSTNALASKDEHIIWQKDRNVFVKLSSQVSAKNQHPTKVTTEKLQQFFSNVTYTTKKKSDLKPVFDEKQIDVLSKHVQNALAQASSNQDVLFSIDRVEKTFGGLSTTEYLTAGTIFLTSSGINLILGDVDKKRDSAYESVYDPTGQGLVKYDLDHGSRKSSLDRYHLSFAGQKSTGTSASWIAVPFDTVAAVSQRMVNAQQAQVTGVPADVVKREELDALLEKQTQSVRAEIKQAMTEVKASQAQIPPATAVETQKAASASAQDAEKSESLAERFKVLKELRELGLITEDEYQSKRQELLSEI